MLQSLTEEQSRQVQDILDRLLRQAEARVVYLCDRGGNLLGQSSTEDYEAFDNIAALGAGSFSATRELARLIGEEEFDSVFHQGPTVGIYTQGAPRDSLVMIIFDRASNLGMVKIYTARACKGLAVALAATADSAERPQFELNPDAEPFRFEES